MCVWRECMCVWSMCVYLNTNTNIRVMHAYDRTRLEAEALVEDPTTGSIYVVGSSYIRRIQSGVVSTVYTWPTSMVDFTAITRDPSTGMLYVSDSGMSDCVDWSACVCVPARICGNLSHPHQHTIHAQTYANIHTYTRYSQHTLHTYLHTDWRHAHNRYAADSHTHKSHRWFAYV